MIILTILNGVEENERIPQFLPKNSQAIAWNNGTQLIFTCSKSKIETVEKRVKYVRS